MQKRDLLVRVGEIIDVEEKKMKIMINKEEREGLGGGGG
jgi:hypothetical protein